MTAVFDPSRVANEFLISGAIAALSVGGAPCPDKFVPFTFRGKTEADADRKLTSLASFKSSEGEEWNFFSESTMRAWLEYCSAAQRRQ